MKRSSPATIAAAVLVLAGCGGGDSATGAKAPGTGVEGGDGKPAADAKPNSGLSVKASGSQYGKVLFSASNRAIYYFAKESGRTARCYGACAKAWPPALTNGRPQAGAGAKSGLLGTTMRRDGRGQATYKGHPLYYYVNDPRGKVGCHNVEEFGGLWLAVRPSGAPVG